MPGFEVPVVASISLLEGPWDGDYGASGLSLCFKQPGAGGPAGPSNENTSRQQPAACWSPTESWHSLGRTIWKNPHKRRFALMTRCCFRGPAERPDEKDPALTQLRSGLSPLKA